MKIKFLSEIKEPFKRKRDDCTVTHRLSIALTTDEALLVSELLKAKQDAKEPSISLIRAILCQMSTAFIDDVQLLQYMADWRTKKQLAMSLSEKDYSRIMSILSNHNKSKELVQPPTKEKREIAITPKSERRVFIPETRRR